MDYLTALSKLELAIIRRLPFHIQEAYIPKLGQTLDFPKNASSTFHQIFEKHCYKPIRSLPKNSVIADLGANLGLFAMYMNSVIDEAKIYSFEASPNLFPYLEKNIDRMPKRSNKVELFNVAISNSSGTLDFYYDSSNPAAVNGSAYRDRSRVSGQNVVTVNSSRLEKYLEGRIDYLKCDIEGAEYVVLEDEFFTQDRFAEAVVEFHDLDKKYNEFCHVIDIAALNKFRFYLNGDRVETSASEILSCAQQLGAESLLIHFCK